MNLIHLNERDTYLTFAAVIHNLVNDQLAFDSLTVPLLCHCS